MNSVAKNGPRWRYAVKLVNVMARGPASLGPGLLILLALLAPFPTVPNWVLITLASLGGVLSVLSVLFWMLREGIVSIVQGIGKISDEIDRLRDTTDHHETVSMYHVQRLSLKTQDFEKELAELKNLLLSRAVGSDDVPKSPSAELPR